MTQSRIAKAVLVVLSIAMVRGASANPAAASPSATAAPPLPAIPHFGLHLGDTGPVEAGLSGFLFSLRARAMARTCVNRCPPTTWTAPDPLLGALGKIKGGGLAIGAGGAGLAIGGLALRSSHRSNASWLRRLARSLTVKPAPGGAGLSFSF